MSRKKYGIFGMVETSTVIGQVRIPFKNGSITNRGITPATFSTSNKNIQEIIENSEQFKSKKIKLVNETESESTVSVKDYPEVTNMQSARAILMGSPYNIELSELQNKNAILSKAKEVDISFSNWK